MPVRINEVNSEVRVIDASSLLTDELLQLITARVVRELESQERNRKQQERDAGFLEQRRVKD